MISGSTGPQPHARGENEEQTRVEDHVLADDATSHAMRADNEDDGMLVDDNREDTRPTREKGKEME